MKKTIFTTLFIGTQYVIYSQVPFIEWEKNYGGTSVDWAYDLQTTSDSGYIVVGTTFSADNDVTENNGLTDYWIVKIDDVGNIQWQKSYGGSKTETATSVFQCFDGSYIVAGYSYSFDGDVIGAHGDADMWIIKLNISGEIEWQKAIGGSAYDEATQIFQTIDNGFIISGRTESNDGDVTLNYGEHDYWVVKIDDVGNIQWQKSYGGSFDEYCFSIVPVLDGGYVLAGYTFSIGGDITSNHGDGDYWIVKIDSIGNMQWQKCYGGTQFERAFCITNCFDGGYIIAGQAESSDFDVSGNHGGYADYWIVKIDSIGNMQWQKCYGGTGADDATFIKQMPDSSYIISGGSNSYDYDVTGFHGPPGYQDVWAICIDTLGSLLWQKCLGGTSVEDSWAIQNTYDSGLIISAFTSSTDGDIESNYGSADFWTIKLSFPCIPQVYYADFDGDSFGDIYSDSTSCTVPIGYVSDSSDCNDVNESIFPTAEDICNSIDDNCNGEIDEDALFILQFADEDGDGFGDIMNDSVSCFELTGFVLDSADCNDADIFINPVAPEICNEIDDNCNTDIDEGLTIFAFYADADGDGFGNADIIIYSCIEIIAGYVSDSTDCDDTNNLIYPGAEEICNYLDDDCDAIVDDNLSYIHSYQDADGDDFGNIEIDSLACTIPFGYVEDDSDCDDTNPNIYPGATEILNGLDDDCDGLTDENLAISNELINAIRIYPNPTENILHIDYDKNVEVEIEIINIIGRSILTTKLLSFPADISVDTYAPGMYLLNIQVGDEEISIPFVKESY